MVGNTCNCKGIRRDEQGYEKQRVYLCRAYCVLCVHANYRDGK